MMIFASVDNFSIFSFFLLFPPISDFFLLPTPSEIT